MHVRQGSLRIKTLEERTSGALASEAESPARRATARATPTPTCGRGDSIQHTSESHPATLVLRMRLWLCECLGRAVAADIGKFHSPGFVPNGTFRLQHTTGHANVNSWHPDSAHEFFGYQAALLWLPRGELSL